MQPPRRVADVFGDGGRKSDDVVLGDLLDFFDACDVETCALPNLASGVGGNNPGAGHGVERGEFNLQPRLVFALVAPDATHVRTRVPVDHASESFSGGSFKPLTAPSTVAESAPSANRSRATRCTSSVVTASIPASVSSRPKWRSK